MSKKYILINGKKHYIKTEPTKVKKEEEDEEIVDEEKSVDKIAENIAQKLAELTKTKEKDLKKKDKVVKANKEVKLIDREENILTTRFGKDISLKHSQVLGLTDWFKAFVRDDKASAMAYYQKHEPLNEGTNAEGGFLVPTILYNVIVKWQEDEAVIKPRAKVIDMSGMKTNQLNISGIASKPRVSWTSEKSAKSTSSMEFQQQALTPYKLAAIITITDELIEDSPFNIVSLVSAELADAITKEEDRVFAVGTGTAQPTGIDAYTWASTNCGGAMTLDHIQTAYFRVSQSYRNKAYWLMNSRAIEHIANLKDSNNRPLLLEEGIITDSRFPSLKRRPVLEQNDIASSKIFFVDLSKYWIGVKHPMKIEMAKEATVAGDNLWEKNMKAIRIEERIDAEVVDTRAGYELTNTGIS
jgi:HK97 family phage major capsid protein